jgi:hypothetical protein
MSQHYSMQGFLPIREPTPCDADHRLPVTVLTQVIILPTWQELLSNNASGGLGRR